MSLLSRLADGLANSPHQTILDAPDATYGPDALGRQVDAVAAALLERGVSGGDRVTYLGFNSAAQIVLIFAAARIGVMVCPLNWRLAAEELRWMVDDADPVHIVADPAHRALAEAVAGARPLSCIHEINEAPAGAPDHAEPSAEAPLLLVYTSGATGRPKGAVLTQAALMANADLAIDMHSMVPGDHVLTALPMFHVGGVNIQTMPALLTGARVTLMDRFEPGACLDLVAARRPTLTVQVPATLGAMIEHPSWPETPLDGLRAIATGSTDVPISLIKAVHRRGPPVIQIYGATETGPVVIYQKPQDAVARLGSIGRAGPGVTVSIRDASGREAPEGEIGEIWLKSPTLARGYWRNPAAQQAFADGWFRTGDMARRDVDGFLWFADRLKNVIISGGENIYPAELERVLSGLPSLVEAAVVGRPDKRWGAVPVAVVVGDLDREQVLGAFDGHLARFKHPKDVVFVDALPRNAMGKVETAAVRALVTS